MQIDLSEKQLIVLTAVLEFAYEQKMLSPDQRSVVRDILVKGQATLNQDYLDMLTAETGGGA